MAESGNNGETAKRLACGVESVCTLLMSPDSASLEAATARLESAVGDLRGLASDVESGRIQEDLASDLSALAAALRRSRLLLANASAFHARRTACLAAALDGYQCGGAPAQLVAGNRIAIDG